MASTNVYTPPGVTIVETTTPSVAPTLASPADICIVGLAGSPSSSLAQVQTTDTVLLTGTAPHILPTLASLNNDAQLVSVQAVTDILNPSVGTPLGSGYTITSDYTVSLGEGPPDGSHGTISRVGSGTIPDGTLVAVTYTYVPSDYWNPIRLFDIGSVESRFGPSWATAINSVTGQTFYTGVASQLSMAARIAFENGAQSIICQPLFALQTPGSNPGDAGYIQQAPTATAVGDPGTWSDTLKVLRSIEDLNIIVPIVGQDNVNVSSSNVLNIFGAVQSHLSFMNSQEQYIVAIFGEDGTNTTSTFQTLLSTIPNTHAPQLQANFGNVLSSQMVLLNNTLFQRATPGGFNNTINIGGQYFAAGVAGALGARPVASSLTRSSIIGFTGVTDPRTPSDKNNDAAAGLMVIEQNQGIIRIRHALTLDVQNGPARAQLSVVRAKFLMVESIKQTIDNQIIGQIIADANSPIIVRSVISGILSLLQQAGSIVAFSAVNAELSSINPTLITASFSYRPAFPVDYVHVSFSLDLTNNTITLNQTAGT